MDNQITTDKFDKVYALHLKIRLFNPIWNIVHSSFSMTSVKVEKY